MNISKKSPLAYDSTVVKISLHYFCTIFAQFFVHFLQIKKSCAIVGEGERKMRAEQIERLKMETKSTENEVEKLEREFEEFEREIKQNKEIVRLARLIVSG